MCAQRVHSDTEFYPTGIPGYFSKDRTGSKALEWKVLLETSMLEILP